MADEHLIERKLSGAQVYRGHFLDVRRDTIVSPDGGKIGRAHV